MSVSVADVSNLDAMLPGEDWHNVVESTERTEPAAISWHEDVQSNLAAVQGLFKLVYAADSMSDEDYLQASGAYPPFTRGERINRGKASHVRVTTIYSLFYQHADAYVNVLLEASKTIYEASPLNPQTSAATTLKALYAVIFCTV